MTGPASIRLTQSNALCRKYRSDAGHWNRQLGFTLVELLVVVGILAVLAGLILSALSRGRGKAASITCLSNVRQSGQLLSAFVLDNNAYPFEGKSGVDELGDTQSGDWAVSLYQKQYPQLVSTNGSWRGVLHCPSVKTRPASFPPHRIYYEYGYNVRGVSRKGYGDLFGLGRMKSEKSLVPVKANLVVNPANMMAIGDGFRGASTGIWDGTPQIGRRSVPKPDAAASDRVYARHAQRANMVFCDGHAEAVRVNDLFVSKSPDHLRRWNRDDQPHLDIAP